MTDGDLWILSYDVDGHDRETSVRVCRLIFGRRNTTTREGNPATYEQPGFIHRPGVVWVGQSVLILPRKDAAELTSRLRALGSSLNTTRKLKKSRPAAPMIRTFRGSALRGSAMGVRKPRGLKAFPVRRYRLNDVSAPGGAARAQAACCLSSGAGRRPVGVAEAGIRRCGTRAYSQHPDCCPHGVLSGISPRNSYYIAVLMDVHDR